MAKGFPNRYSSWRNTAHSFHSKRLVNGTRHGKSHYSHTVEHGYFTLLVRYRKLRGTGHLGTDMTRLPVRCTRKERHSSIQLPKIKQRGQTADHFPHPHGKPKIKETPNPHTHTHTHGEQLARPVTVTARGQTLCAHAHSRTHAVIQMKSSRWLTLNKTAARHSGQAQAGDQITCTHNPPHNT